MTRKVYDDSTGEHVTKPGYATADDVFDPIVGALAVRCPSCRAEPGKPCITRVGPRKDRVYPHPDRGDLARSKR